MCIHLRVDKQTPEHVTQTVFIDGQNCGRLTMSYGQYQLFGAALLLAKDKMIGHLEVELDSLTEVG